MSRLKLHFALAISLLLHLAVLLWPAPQTDAPPPAAALLQARLRPAPAADRPAEPAPTEPVLKDTRSENTNEAPAARQPAPPEKRPSRRAQEHAQERAQRILNRHVFYPQEAIDRGLEGEVRLRLTLAADGRVLDAGILASSGHALLDQAALQAARHIGRIDAGGARELMLPVLFRLE
ncbi:energy transducer TonB [Methyloversatilis thermotolerans]|uniref:energy transducer TonB n=1 Tax=Methyloversatilis thermotolerans TaxID=1346290 RepID=UPI0003A75BCA|nr:energy transducer TonB [Methyloversatilis thermotolerans]